VETRLAALPGVETVALTTGVPIWGYGTVRHVYTEAQADADKANVPRASHVMITADFFKVLGVSLLEGRMFAPDIKPDDPRVVIVNAALARQFWPGESAIGRRIASINGEETTWAEIIGVVPDVESAADIGNGETPLQVYRPIVHEPWSWVRFAIRSEKPETLTDTVRLALAEVDADLPATDIMTPAETGARLIVVAILGGANNRARVAAVDSTASFQAPAQHGPSSA
jgi:hypothetical protein